MKRYKVYSQKLAQVAKYALVGGTSFVTEFATFSLLILLFPESLLFLFISQTFSYILALIVNFIGTYRFTFSNNRHNYRNSLPTQVKSFAALALVNLIISNLVIYTLIHPFGLNPFLAKILVMGMVITWNYTIFSRFIFKAAK